MSGPLEGRRILVTRSRAQVGEFSRLLREAGADVVEIPAIEIVPRPNRELDPCIAKAHRFDWLFFTSVNGAEIFLSRARELDSPFSGKDGPSPRICAIGPATARRVERFGREVHLVPARYQAEGVLEAFLELHSNRIEGLSILIPRASQARSLLPRELSRYGAQVEVVPVYDTVVPEESRLALKQALDTGTPDLITFTSSSTVRHLMKLATDPDAVRSVPCAAIGPITAETAREYGFQVVVESSESTIPGLFAAICDDDGGKDLRNRR